MDRKYVESEAIESIGYDFPSGILEIEFKSNNVIWQYPDFPEYMWYEFESAESKGKYFHANINKQFTPNGYRVG
ncbi:hypothetical protein SH1V18_38360 [Vallitalea longa]|uniref:KTSC domain-containing protein n=1 Tax=Vallitalea longa TaxID=2936439 RepID=A0A9W5YET1_9FIRM|nr:KTSC domain-containing protein [Vallitalea longa]GKX31356.1 hypothetical protein SH1V18_38360 [Vallitalea longa]